MTFIDSPISEKCSLTMENQKKKSVKRESRKVVGGVKLPPIEPVKDDDVKTILDIDPDFFSSVQGRPIRPNNSYLKYKQDIKEIAMKRAIQGYLIDEAIRMDREIEDERQIYQKAYKLFEECQYSFDKFLAYDNDKTIVIMQKSDNLAKHLRNQTEEHKKVSYEMASLKSKLQYIDETLLILLSLQNFLNKASPIIWQDKNDIKLDTEYTKIITMDNNIYKKTDKDEIKARLSELPPPKLYFETPSQLLNVFDYLEKQNLDYFLVTGEVNSEKNNFLQARDSFKKRILEDSLEIQGKIKDVEDIIKWNDTRVLELKKIYFKILEDKIKFTTSSDIALKQFTHVEFTYEQLIAPNDTKQSTIDMAVALENEYDQLMLDLATCDLDVVKKVEKEVYEGSNRAIKKAKLASRLLKDIDKLNRRLKTAFEPPRKEATY